MQSKMTGNIVFVLLPPISYLEFFAAYVLAAVVRGLVVGAGVMLATVWFVDLRLEAPLWTLVFGLAGAALAGALGLIAGLFSEKVDQLAAFQNFVILPFTMLAGVFYSVRSLPAHWEQLSHFNPFFYMVDGFRYVLGRPILLGIFLVDTNAMIFGMPMALFPAIGEHYGGGATVVGLLYGAPYIGALLASLVSGWTGHVRRQGLGVVAAAVGALVGDRPDAALRVGRVGGRQ
jgi:ABC-type multidrug transport system permease subunit